QTQNAVEETVDASEEQTTIVPFRAPKSSREIPLTKGPYPLIGSSEKMERIRERIRMVSQVKEAVLVTGATGTGKELVVKNIHRLIDEDSPLVIVDFACLSDTLAESELYGHVKGAFTDAKETRPGLVERSRGGVLFLDEIETMPRGQQPKLLRFLEDYTIRRLGTNVLCKIQTKIVAATNKRLLDLVEIGQFREDLYYRLNQLVINLPPLRERISDIPELVAYFRNTFQIENRISVVPEVSDEAIAFLQCQDWPGNVRQLKTAVVRTITENLHSTKLTSGHFRFLLDDTTASDQPLVNLPSGGVPLETIEREAIVTALRRTGGIQNLAARLLFLSPRVLNYKIKVLGLREYARRSASNANADTTEAGLQDEATA
ncbi:MAG: sigma 54-interacting transcriptional regulator, partial [Acidobacteriaceae bacterium]